jgi:hypothetical protein
MHKGDHSSSREKVALSTGEKLDQLEKFLAGSHGFEKCTLTDSTAASLARLIAAHGDNPYWIVDHTGPSPREILAPDNTWGQITPVPEQRVPSATMNYSTGSVLLELHNQHGRFELLLESDEKDVVLQEIALFRQKRA